MERQHHGFSFQEIISNLYGADKTGYTDKWDFIVDNSLYSVKNIKDKGAVELGSLLRFYENTSPFTMIVARHDAKKIISVDSYAFTNEILTVLKGNLTLEEVKEASNTLTISNFPEGQHEAARKYFKEWKTANKHKFGLLTLTGKVDSAKQRRWQCNINYSVWKKLFGHPSLHTVFMGYSFN